ncbi:DUF1289 domain-containing protein [Sphingosinicella vermicomposti]|uniref:DUF1289 domain-containing protein n=1 Tax=Allosphingosinicella vermicomposti TaxID=614671 RepID=UPI000D0E6EC8
MIVRKSPAAPRVSRSRKARTRAGTGLSRTSLTSACRTERSGCLALHGRLHVEFERTLCVGCGRTLVEIGEWIGASDARKREIVAAAGERKSTLSSSPRRTPGSQDE